MIKQITTAFVITTFLATNVFAQTDTGSPMGLPEGLPPPPPPGFRPEMRKEMRENIEKFKEERKEAMGEFKETIKERRIWNAQNASGTATGTRPAPFKDLREDMRDARKDFREGVKDMRDKMKDEMRGMMPPRMATLTATQTAAIAAKLGISVDTLNAQLASGTKLKEIIKDKIKPEDMKAILPPRVASMTRPIQEQGFFNSLRSKLFGPREVEVHQSQNEFGEIEETEKPVQSNNFFRRLFNW